METKSKLKEFLSSSTGGILLTVVLYVFSILIMVILGGLSDNLNGAGKTAEVVITIFSLIVSAVWIYFGWKSLSIIQPKIFLIMPIVGWIFYFGSKGLLSIVVGIFTTPYQISKIIRKNL